MGKYADLVNQPIQFLAMSKDWEVDKGKPVDSEKRRFDVIQRFAESAKSVDVYANKEFRTTFVDSVETLKKGKNSVSPRFAVYLLGKYGLDNRYGNLAKTNDTWVNDEPFETGRLAVEPKRTVEKAKKNA